MNRRLPRLIPAPWRRAAMLFLLVVVCAAVSGCANLPAPSAAQDTTQPSLPIDSGPIVASSGAHDAASPAATSTDRPAAPAASAAAGSVDACALLESDHVSDILGGDVETTSMPSTGWVAGRCAWNGAASGFLLSVGTDASFAAFGDHAALNQAARLAQFKQTTAGATDVPDVGDGAAMGSGQLALTSGSTYFEIMGLGLTDKQLVALAKLLAAGP